MEWDSERAGGFEPLRLLPSDKTVVLGLVTTKSGALESADALARRIDEASRHVPARPPGLSPQCGFASTHHGNALTEDEQWRKLARVVEVARDGLGRLTRARVGAGQAGRRARTLAARAHREVAARRSVHPRARRTRR